jgi:hypothetical protein
MQLFLPHRFIILASTTQPMRRSREVHLTLLAAVALSMTACRTQQRDCIDPQGHKEPDSFCNATSGRGIYRYVYGGASGGHFGDSVIGGSSTPRGGFGGIGGGDSAGGE